MANGKVYKIDFKLAADMTANYRTTMQHVERDFQSIEHQFRAIEALRMSGDMIKPVQQKIGNLKNQLKEIKNINGPNDFFKALKIEVQAILPDLREVKHLMTDISRIQQPNNRFGDDAEKYVRQLREMEQRMRAVSQQAGPHSQPGGAASAKSEGSSGVGGLLIAGGTAALAGVAAVGAAGFFALKGANDYQKAMNQIQASTMASSKDMQSLKSAAKGVYTSGLGEGWEEISQVMGKAKQVTQQTGKQLENTTKNAIGLQATFENLDVESSLKAAQTAVRNFGISSDQAYNLFAQGAAKGLDYSGELLDTSNEYSVYFKKLGFDANQMFDIFAAGAENGAFNLDKVGDAVKEFGIRSKDGSKTSADAYKLLGLNAKKMTAEFAKGGPAAQKAWTQVGQALKSMKDPVKQNAAAVGLFGTQAEDMEIKVILALANARKQFDLTKDSMEEVRKIKYNDIGTAFKMIGRQLNAALIIPIADKMLPALSAFSNWFNREAPLVSTRLESMGEALKPLMSAIRNVGELFQNAMNRTGDMSAATGISQFLINMGVAEDKAYKFSGALSDTFDKLAKLKSYFEIFKGAGSLLGNALAGTGDISAVTGINKALQSIGFSEDQSIQISGCMIDMFDNIKKSADQFLSTLAPGFEESAKFIKSLFSNNFIDFGSILPEFTKIRAAILPIAKEIASGIGPAFKAVGVIANSVLKFLQSGFNALYPPIFKMVSVLVQKVGPVFTDVFGYITKTLLPQVSAVIAEWLPKIVPVISGLAQLFNAVLIPIVNQVVTAFRFAWPILAAIVTGAINMIKPAISMLLDVLSGVITFLTGVFTGNWTQAFEGLKQIALGIFDGIVGIVKGAVNSVIGIINGMISSVNNFKYEMPEWAGGVTIGGLSIPSIPTFADGGFSNQPSIFGEAGPEAAIPLNNKQRSMDILAKTNRIMGYQPADGGDNLNLSFNITIQGNADKEVVQQAVQATQPAFKQQYQQMKRQNARVSLS